MYDDLRIHDIHRIIGPLPHDASPTADLPSLTADLTHLGVSSCSAVASWQLYGDPSGRDGQTMPDDEPAVQMVPVVIPAAVGAGWPDGPSALVAAGISMVRACPVRHRWSLDSAVAAAWWEALAAAGCAVALDLTEVGFGAAHALARTWPALTVVGLNPGYRELRRCAEILAERPNVIIETGTLNTAGGVEWLAGVAGIDRLAFGTGGPVADDAGATWLLRHLDLPRDQVQRIAHGTAHEMLGAPA